jgi:hypothetical protein
MLAGGKGRNNKKLPPDGSDGSDDFDEGEDN